MIDIEESENDNVRLYLDSIAYNSFKENIIRTFTNNDFKIISHSRYPSGIRNVVLKQQHSIKTPEHNFLESLRDRVLEKMKEVKIAFDNKIVIEIQPILLEDNSKYFEIHSPMFFSMKDGLNSLGLESFQVDGFKPIYL
jgi:uncharacterized protein YueI